MQYSTDAIEYGLLEWLCFLCCPCNNFQYILLRYIRAKERYYNFRNPKTHIFKSSLIISRFCKSYILRSECSSFVKSKVP